MTLGTHGLIDLLGLSLNLLLHGSLGILDDLLEFIGLRQAVGVESPREVFLFNTGLLPQSIEGLRLGNHRDLCKLVLWDLLELHGHGKASIGLCLELLNPLDVLESFFLGQFSSLNGSLLGILVRGSILHELSRIGRVGFVELTALVVEVDVDTEALQDLFQDVGLQSVLHSEEFLDALCVLLLILSLEVLPSLRLVLWALLLGQSFGNANDCREKLLVGFIWNIAHLIDWFCDFST